MKILCVDPIISGGRVCSFSLFGEDSCFLIQQINDLKESKKYFNKKYKCVCFDAFKTIDMFEDNFSFFYDVRVLYALKGYKFNSLIDLSREIFGYEYIQKYVEISEKIKAHFNSYMLAKIDVSKYSEDQYLPEGVLQTLYKERACVIVDLLERFEKEGNVDILKFYDDVMLKTIKALHSIGKQPININLNALDGIFNYHVDVIKKNTINGKALLKFNAVGAKTGRLSCRKGSINIYSLPKDLRNCIEASENYFIAQFDFKSLHPRIAIFSTENNDFKNKFANIDDIYSVFPGDRDKNKISFLAWMYSDSKNTLFEKEAFAICELRNKLYRDSQRGKIINKFGRVLNCEGEQKKVVFQNYITSVEVDVILGLVRLINGALKNRKSRILFPFHDAIVCEIHDDEEKIVKNIKDCMEVHYKKMFGSAFPVEVKIGKNFRDLKGV